VHGKALAEWVRGKAWIEHLPPKSLSFSRERNPRERKRERGKQGVVGSKALSLFEKREPALREKLLASAWKSHRALFCPFFFRKKRQSDSVAYAETKSCQSVSCGKSNFFL